MDLYIAAIDPTDQPTLDAAYRIAATAEAMDAPDLPPLCRRRFEAPLRHPMPGIDTRWSVAHLDGVPVGWVRINLHLWENTENASIELVVDPAYRRRGVGRALFAHARELLREAGRKRVVGSAVAALPGAEGSGEPRRETPGELGGEAPDELGGEAPDETGRGSAG